MDNLKDEPAFEVFDKKNPNKRMRVYANGRIDGFPEGFTCVFNHIPRICRDYYKNIQTAGKGTA